MNITSLQMHRQMQELEGKNYGAKLDDPGMSNLLAVSDFEFQVKQS